MARLTALLAGLMTLMLAVNPGLAAPVAEDLAPAIHGDVWLNSPPLAAGDLRGRVVLVEFWTFGCWNCRNVQPYMKRWHATYADQGLVVLAVHSPEFPREAELANVKQYLRDNDIRYPVPVDNGFVTWKRFGNQAWPTLYLIDKAGRLRYRHVGEGAYDRTELRLQQLLAEPSPATGPASPASPLRPAGASPRSPPAARALPP